MSPTSEFRANKIIEAIKATYPSFFSNCDEEREFDIFLIENFEKIDIIWENSQKLMVFKADRRLDNPIIHIREGNSKAFIKKLI